MAQELITNFESFSPSSISYGAPRTNARGGKSIKILDAKKNTLIMNTPLILTWGINKLEDEETGRVSYKLSIQFPNEQYGNDSTRLFFEKIKDFEDRVLDACVDNAKEWFGKSKFSKEVAEALFTPILRYPKDKVTGEPDYDRAPTMSIKIPYWEGKFNVELYNTDREPIFTPDTELNGKPFETLIPKTSHIAGAIQCNGIWFAGGKFGVTWKLAQAIVKRPIRLQGGCFVSMSDSDKQTLKDVEQREKENAASSNVDEEDEQEDNTKVEDSDEEEEVVKEPEPEPEVKPKTAPKKKRKVVKKKSTA